MNPALGNLASHQAAYHFFDTEVAIRSDNSEIIARFDEIYDRFRVRGPVPRGLICYVLAGGRPFGQPAVVLDGQTRLINDPDTLFDYAHTRVLNAALAQTRNCFPIHGAALSAGGVGIILAGHSGCGKTTLALELVRRGFRFLSDDIAAVGISDHRLYPFPKSLGLWPGTRQLIPEASALPHERAGKQLVDIETLYPHRLGERCPPRVLVVLASSQDEAEQVEGALYVTVDRVSQPLLAELGAIPDVSDVVVLNTQRLPVIKLSLPKRAFIESTVEDICARHQTLLFDVAKNGRRPPDFDASPHLEPLPEGEATLELLRRMRGGARSAILQREFQGSATRLYLALSEVVGKMACYRLFVGKLKETADLACQVVKGGHD